MSYTIAFDVPESEGPTFPSRTYPASTTVLSTSLEDALRFADEFEAEVFLASAEVPFSLRQWGVVVEVGQP